MKNYLLITLGHNSSAIFVDNSSNEQRIIGYEQERLSRIKADSQFPIDAINEIEYNVGFKKMKGCTILVSHWFNSKAISLCKYFSKSNLEKLESYNPEEIKYVNSKFTHHDAHAFSAYAFFKYHSKGTMLSKETYHTIVSDGFGTDEEVLSVYAAFGKNEQPKLIHRVYGYKCSLGLFYQYATSFVGMKQNQDEYKFLGYEAHIDEYFTTEQIDYMDHKISQAVEYFVNAWNIKTKMDVNLRNHSNSIIEFDKLKNTQTFWHAWFSEFCDGLGISDFTQFRTRCAIAYFIQQTCEIALTQLVNEFGIRNLTVSGGTFYNVKLNNKLLTSIEGKFCAMPLAGDQGAAIGMYEAENKNDAPAFLFDTLAWGKRRLYGFEKYNGSNIYYTKVQKGDEKTLADIANSIAEKVSNGGLVDVVFGNMEFGPRALGNTSTIFLPTTENTEQNNRMNMRNEVMPCAPICTALDACQLFDTEELNRVIGSDRFMICTHDYMKPYSAQYGGVMHRKTLDVTHTGRPQIVRPGTFMDYVLQQVKQATDAKCLVNTSFNVHGNPIVFDTKDIIDNFNFQCAHCEYKALALFVIEFV